ncbi:unnamed protein product [Amoebophrya sp. A25]|nr:unnamed protein product [Amoebophrya sp. A25]|eukprot:GSA25T00004123001.1
MSESPPTCPLIPYPHQREAADTAVLGNTVVNVKTGGGKTLIAVLVTDHFLRTQPHKKVLLVVPTVPLLEQQSEYFRKHLADVVVDMSAKILRDEENAEEKDEALFSSPVLEVLDDNRTNGEEAAVKVGASHVRRPRVSILQTNAHLQDQELRRSDVLVGTPDRFLTAIQQLRRLSVDDDLSLVIFDECHHIINVSPMARLCELVTSSPPATSMFHDVVEDVDQVVGEVGRQEKVLALGEPQRSPSLKMIRILGLTASFVNGKTGKSRENLERARRLLETVMKAQMFTPKKLKLEPSALCDVEGDDRGVDQGVLVEDGLSRSVDSNGSSSVDEQQQLSSHNSSSRSCTPTPPSLSNFVDADSERKDFYNDKIIGVHKGPPRGPMRAHFERIFWENEEEQEVIRDAMQSIEEKVRTFFSSLADEIGVPVEKGSKVAAQTARIFRQCGPAGLEIYVDSCLVQQCARKLENAITSMSEEIAQAAAKASARQPGEATLSASPTSEDSSSSTSSCSTTDTHSCTSNSNLHDDVLQRKIEQHGKMVAALNSQGDSLREQLTTVVDEYLEAHRRRGGEDTVGDSSPNPIRGRDLETENQEQVPAPLLSFPHISRKVQALFELFTTRSFETTSGKERTFFRALVFVQDIATVDPLRSLLTSRTGLRVGGVYGKSLQSKREQEETIADFRTGKLDVVITTAILEEGLDVPECNVVVRFDKVTTVKSHIQGAGRARAAAIAVTAPKSEEPVDHEERTNISVSSASTTLTTSSQPQALVEKQHGVDGEESLLQQGAESTFSASCQPQQAFVYYFENCPHELEAQRAQLEAVAGDAEAGVHGQLGSSMSSVSGNIPAGGSSLDEQEQFSSLKRALKSGVHPWRVQEQSSWIDIHNCHKIVNEYIQKVLGQSLPEHVQFVTTMRTISEFPLERRKVLQHCLLPTPDGEVFITRDDVDKHWGSVSLADVLGIGQTLRKKSGQQQDKTRFVFVAAVQLAKLGYLDDCNKPTERACRETVTKCGPYERPASLQLQAAVSNNSASTGGGSSGTTTPASCISGGGGATPPARRLVCSAGGVFTPTSVGLAGRGPPAYESDSKYRSQNLDKQLSTSSDVDDEERFFDAEETVPTSGLSFFSSTSCAAARKTEQQHPGPMLDPAAGNNGRVLAETTERHHHQSPSTSCRNSSPATLTQAIVISSSSSGGRGLDVVARQSPKTGQGPPPAARIPLSLQDRPDSKTKTYISHLNEHYQRNGAHLTKPIGRFVLQAEAAFQFEYQLHDGTRCPGDVCARKKAAETSAAGAALVHLGY